MKVLILLVVLLALAACTNEPKAITDTTDIPPLETDTVIGNEDQTSIYDVNADADDPYLISNGYFLGMTPGGSLADYKDGLRTGQISTGEGEFEVLFIDGAEGDELGFVYSGESDEPTIDQITITSPVVVTDKGVRVGLSFKALQQRLGPVEVYASEIESRVYATKDGITYRLNTNGAPGQTTAKDIDGDVEVMQIILGF